LLFGGRDWFCFTTSDDGSINQGTGEFKDVCINSARNLTTKIVDLQRAYRKDISTMTGKRKTEKERRALADQKIKDCP